MPFADGEWIDLPNSTRPNHCSYEQDKITLIEVAEETVISDTQPPERKTRCIPIDIVRNYQQNSKNNMGYSHKYQNSKINGGLQGILPQPTAISLAGAVDSSATAPAEPVPSSYTATFDAKTMNKVASKRTRRMSKEKAKAIWANRNETCKKHKKQRKRCDPNTCPGNKRWQKRQEEMKKGGAEMAEFRRVEFVDDIKRTQKLDCNIGEVLEQHKNGAGQWVTSDKFGARKSEGSNSSFSAELDFQSPEVIRQAIPPSFRTNRQSTSTQAEAKGKSPPLFPSNGEVIGSLRQLKLPFHRCQDSLSQMDATKLEKRGHNYDRILSQQVPRTALIELDIDAFPWYDEEDCSEGLDNYRLASFSLKSFATSYQYRIKAAKEPDDDGGEGESKWRGASNYDEYGDWFQEYDKQWEDGGGPSGTGQPEAGGGYRKPSGGYYTLASELEDKMAKMSLK